MSAFQMHWPQHIYMYKARQTFQLWSPRIRIRNLLHNNHLPIQTAQAQRFNNAQAVNFGH